MTNTVLLKRSSVANSAPTSLAYGELALNYTDGNLYYQNAANVITVIASNKFVTVTGNVTANYFIGDGSLLTNITVAAGSQIISGTSNVTVAANSNVTVGVTGTTVATFYTAGLELPGNLNATGNVSGNYFIGNGSQLTGIAATVGGANTYVQFNDNDTLAGNAKLTFDKNTGTLLSTAIVFPDSGGNTVGFTAPATVTSPTTWKLPPADGTVYGNVLATDTTGNLMWRGFSSTVFVYTRGNVEVPVAAINGYVNILGRTGNIYVSIT